MGRPKQVSGIRRDYRLEVSIDPVLKDDLTEIGRSWHVPPSTVAYWLLRALMADARGGKLVVTGDDASEKLARYLMRRYPPKNERKPEEPHPTHSEAP